MVSCTSVAQLDYGDNLDTHIKNDTINYSKYDGKVKFLGDNVIFQFFSSPRFKKPVRDRIFFDNEDDKINHIAIQLVKKYYTYDNIDESVDFGVATDTYDFEEYQECLQYARNIVEFNKRKNREDSIRRSRNKIIEYAMCNPQLKYFLTLTYKENQTDYDVVYNDFRKFRNKINMFMKRNFDKKFEFICIFERQKRGAWHMHILSNLDYRMFCDFEVTEWNVKRKIKSEERKKVENILNERIWNKGFIDYRELYDSHGSAFYITKYMTKETDLIMKEEKVKSRYLVSRGLNKAVEKEFTFDNNDLVLKDEKKIALAEVLKMYECLKKQTENFDSNLNNYYFSESLFDDYITPLEKMQGLNRKVREVKFYKNVNFK